MMSRALGVFLACGAYCAASDAAVFFTFEDPGSGPEIQYIEGTSNDMDPGVLSYIGAPVQLVVDGSEEGLASQSFSASLQMEIFIGAVEGQVGNILAAPILGGSFSFTDTGGGDTILSGSLENGGLLTLDSVGALIATSASAGLTMNEGPALAGLLAGMTLIPAFDISFTLTNIQYQNGEGAKQNEDDFIASFLANSAFTGNANVIPSPGSMALLGLSGAVIAIRRKR